jgi:nicotinamide mononucleotide adenylyltransferase
VSDAPEIIDSHLSRFYTENGETVQVCIYRLADTNWTLEVVDLENNSTLWDDAFETDQAAWEEFSREVTVNGIEQFLGEPDPKNH